MAATDFNIPISGGIYAASSSVTNDTSNSVGDYEGAASLTFTANIVEWRGQKPYVQQTAFTDMAAVLNFGSVAFSPSKFLGTMLGITATAGSTKEASPTDASYWNIDSSFSSLEKLEYLIDVTEHSTSKQLQIWAAAGKLAGDIPFSFSRDSFIASDISIRCYEDGSGNFLSFIRENT